jgi:hypothetical protein
MKGPIAMPGAPAPVKDAVKAAAKGGGGSKFSTAAKIGIGAATGTAALGGAGTATAWNSRKKR